MVTATHTLGCDQVSCESFQFNMSMGEVHINETNNFEEAIKYHISTCPCMNEYPTYFSVERESYNDKGLFMDKPIDGQLAGGENDFLFSVERVERRVFSLHEVVYLFFELVGAIIRTDDVDDLMLGCLSSVLLLLSLYSALSSALFTRSFPYILYSFKALWSISLWIAFFNEMQSSVRWLKSLW